MAVPAKADDNLLTTPGAAASAVKEIAAKIGGTPQVSLIEITPDEVVLQVQGEKEFHVNEWRWTIVEFWYFEQSFVSGPNPVRPTRAGRRHRHVVLPALRASRWTRCPKSWRPRSSARRWKTRRRSTASASSGRSRSSPKRNIGEPRWMVSVDSGREHATIYAASRRDHHRRRRLRHAARAHARHARATTNISTRPKADLAAALGDATRVREVGITKSGISVSAEHP